MSSSFSSKVGLQNVCTLAFNFLRSKAETLRVKIVKLTPHQIILYLEPSILSNTLYSKEINILFLYEYIINKNLKKY